MSRIYFLQYWFNLSDPGAEEALYESRSMMNCFRVFMTYSDVP
ncbi:MAG: transposase [Candidatus Thiodiazotropha sp. (ex Lucinoma borealis)]|nr:transposase [Candidatus Thiodiazotropha sp. (ex Lucinoma borealis)]